MRGRRAVFDKSITSVCVLCVSHEGELSLVKSEGTVLTRVLRPQSVEPARKPAAFRTELTPRRDPPAGGRVLNRNKFTTVERQ